jgi:exonuclease III
MNIKIFSYNIRGLPFFPDSWTEPIGVWFEDCDYDFVCLQEVFTQGRINTMRTSLEKEGYTVLKPNDFAEHANILGSGLITAVKTKNWTVINDGFTQFTDFTGAENLANKGFHWLLLESKNAREQLIIVNTHMQADHPCNYFSGCTDTRPIRRNQMIQIINYLSSVSGIRHLIIGDLNSEAEPHEDIEYLTGPVNGIAKHTFEPTGEDLDHIAICKKVWRWTKPILIEVSVLTKLWWSDHWPLHVVLRIIS